MILKLSKKIVRQRLLNIIIPMCVFSVLFYFFPPFDSKLIWMIAVYAIIILPSFALLMEYYKHTYKIDSVEFTETSFTVNYKDGFKAQFDYKEVKILDIYMSASMDRGNYSFNSIERYYFANIITNDGKHIVLTSLLGPDLRDAFDMMKDVYTYRVKTKYAYIFLNVD